MTAHPDDRGDGRASPAPPAALVRWVLAICVVLVAASCDGTGAKSATSSTTTATTAATSATSATSATAATRAATTTAGAGAPQSSRVTTTTATPAAWSLVTEPKDGLQPIYSLMSGARHHLDMTMYELADTKAVAILEADAARGVSVRVILDKDYAGASVNAAAYSELRSHGVQVHWAPASTIFHQKTITVDDHTSAVMTLNLTSEYYASSRDFAVITTNSADVAAIEKVFGADWTDTGPPQTGPAGANLVWSPGAQAPILALIDTARHSLLVENEEMDDSDVAGALEAAAGRGVKVEVVMTYSSSYAHELRELVSAGVKVSTYAEDAALYIHAKVIVADGGKAFVGSQNFSDASLNYNRELGLTTTDPTLVRALARTLSSDFAGATPLRAESAVQ